MHLRGVLPAAAALVVSLATGRAFAWQEAHQTGDDVGVHVDTAGIARVEHALKWHVVRGPLKYVDLVHVDRAAAIDPDVAVEAEDGRSLLAHAARRDDNTIRITVDEPRALMRGDFTFDIAWRIDLAATHALERDGANWRLNWSAPVAPDGFDSARTVFDFPAAPDAPQAILPETGAVDDGVVAKLFRDADRDRLELVRPHVAHGEAPVWTVRLDPQALAALTQPADGAAATSTPQEPDRIRDVSLAVGLGTLALLFGLVVRQRARSFADACGSRDATPRALLPLRASPRAALAGIALATGVGLQVAEHVAAGGACIALSIVAATLRAPAWVAKPRGPGRWLALRPEEAFARPPSGWTADALAAVVVLAAVAGVAWFGDRFNPMAPWLVVLDATVLVPLFVTGRSTQMPPDPARTGTPWLARVFRKLRAVPELRVSPWARVPLDQSIPDELRLLVLPRAAMPGVLGIELGLAWCAAPAGWSAAPEVLTRVVDGSPAAVWLARELPGLRTVTGRRPDERVLRLLPRTPTRAALVALSRSLAETLTDRREAQAAKTWVARERRTVRPPRRVIAAAPADAAA